MSRLVSAEEARVCGFPGRDESASRDARRLAEIATPPAPATESTPVTPRRFRIMRLDDGTAWPEPLRDGTLADKLNCYIADTVTLTRHEAWALREIVGAYANLVEHPAGVEAAVVKLRMLRRKVREVARG